MAHYAFINDSNIVTQVIVGRNENEVVDGISDWEAYYGERMGKTCLRTSYNTRAGEHTEGGTPFRGNYAGIGYSYDETLDAFIPPQPYSSWTLNETTYSWEAPVAYPTDGGLYTWNETQQTWEAVPSE
jgi:hypothetical protein